MIAAMILAAGKSSRIDYFPKANLLYKGNTFLEQGISLFRSAGINSVYAVVGHNKDAILKKHEESDIRFVENNDYEEGQLSSIQAVLSVLSDDTEAVFIHLVDQPLVKVSTIEQIVSEYRQGKSLIVVPTYGEKRGHPVLFSNKVFAQLLNAPREVGARQVVWDNQKDVTEFEADDHGVLININTRHEYEKWCAS